MSEQLLIILLAIAVTIYIVARLISRVDKEGKPKEGRGKRCPKCGAIVSIHRTKCRHCGHVFE